MVKGRIANFGIFVDVFEFLVLYDFFLFSKKLGFGVFLVHPPMALVLLSASVERCFVSRMRDFSFLIYVRAFLVLKLTLVKKIKFIQI